ncbi:MAG TPA: monovalent cation/H(+) antiporter subunit G [Nocardioides sp.]|jgi:multisubunit Na+/H+ antiporter MnhG subunit|nr:monovalent cation/H(+) antiporter subunit G [Nocardioides sp.]
MTLGDVVSWALLAAGSLALVLAGVGTALPRNALVRLHYLNLATMVGTPLLLLGLLVRDPGDWIKLVAILVLLVGTSPAAGAATARALSRTENAGSQGGP